jgi:uncharacterized coiled-coil protein SlyX
LTECHEREISAARSAEAKLQRQLSLEEKRSLSLEAVVKETQTFLEESRKKVKDLTAELENLRHEVAAMEVVPQPPPSPPKDAVEESDIVVTLRADNARLRSEMEEQVRKFNTIEHRYKSGDLVRFLPSHLTRPLIEPLQTDQEKSLVRTIRAEARIAQEQQLDMKSNEIMRVSLVCRLFPARC